MRRGLLDSEVECCGLARVVVLERALMTSLERDERREREGECEGALRLPYGISQGLIATCLRRGTDILRGHVLIQPPSL